MGKEKHLGRGNRKTQTISVKYNIVTKERKKEVRQRAACPFRVSHGF